MNNLLNDVSTLEELVNSYTKEFDDVSRKITLIKDIAPGMVADPANKFSYAQIVDPNQSPLLKQLKQLFCMRRDVHACIEKLCSTASLNKMSVSELEKNVAILKSFKIVSDNLSQKRDKYINDAFEYILLPLLDSIGLPKQTHQVQRSKIVMKSAPWRLSMLESIKYTVVQVTTPLFGKLVNIDHILNNLTKTIADRNIRTQAAQEHARVLLQRDSVKQATLKFIDDYFGLHSIGIQLNFLTYSLLEGEFSYENELRVIISKLEQALTSAVTHHSAEAIHIECCDHCDTYVPGEHRCSCGNRRINMYVEISYFADSNESFVSIQTEAY